VTRGNVRRRLALAWWWQLFLTLAPLFVVNGFFGSAEPMIPVLAMPFFIAGIASMFLSLKPFGAYKHALIATQKSLDPPKSPPPGSNSQPCAAVRSWWRGCLPGLRRWPSLSGWRQCHCRYWRFPVCFCCICIGCRGSWGE